jgi:hypothetical protein
VTETTDLGTGHGNDPYLETLHEVGCIERAEGCSGGDEAVEKLVEGLAEFFENREFEGAGR